MAKTAKAKTRAKAEPQSRKSKPDDAEQYKRFRDFAREVETDEDRDAFDHAFRKIVAPKLLPDAER
jgi:hypothetical protein